MIKSNNTVYSGDSTVLCVTQDCTASDQWTRDECTG